MSDSFFDLLQYGDKVRVATPKNTRQFGTLRGRFFFDVVDHTGGRTTYHPVQFRIDPHTQTISGDLFSYPADEGRPIWEMSWISDALYVFDQQEADRPWDLAAICQLRRPGTEGGNGVSEILFLTASVTRKGKHPRLDAFEMAVIQNGTTVAERCKLVTDETRTDGRTAPVGFYNTFREITLELLVDKHLTDDAFMSGVIKDALGENDHSAKLTWNIHQVGVYVIAPQYQDLSAATIGDVIDPSYNVYLHRLEDPEPDPFKFTILLSNDQDVPGQDRFPIGRALGLTVPPHLFYNRTVAAVFPREVLASYKAVNPGFDPAAPTEADIDAMSFRLRFYIIHELSHLLNLPHPWDRANSDLPGMRNEPQAASWTNYGSRYPFGPLNAYLHHAQDDDAARLKRSAEVMHGVFQRAHKRDRKERVRFSRAEKRHIRHASYDQIAAGQASFTNNSRRHLSMKAASIIGPRISLDMLKMSRGDHQGTFYHNGRVGQRYEPIVGVATLSVPEDHVTPGHDPHDHSFRFGSGNLFLLIREEFATGQMPNSERRSLIYRLPPLTIGSKAHRRNQLVGSHHPETGIDGKRIYETMLPLIRPQWLSDHLGGARTFTIQAVYLEADKNPVYSNQPCIRYHPNADPDPLAPIGAEHLALFEHPNLAMVSQGARYFDQPDQMFPTPFSEISTMLMNPDLVAATATRDDLRWLAVERAVILGGLDLPDDAPFDGPVGGALRRIIARRDTCRGGQCNAPV